MAAARRELGMAPVTGAASLPLHLQLRPAKLAPQHQQHRAPQRAIAARCLGPRRPFQQAPLEGTAKPAGDVSSAALAAAQGTPAEAAPPLSQDQLGQLRGLVGRLERTVTYGDKLEVLMAEPAAERFLKGTKEGRVISQHLRLLPPKEAYALACLPAIGQGHALRLLPRGDAELAAGLARLAGQLGRVQDFYDSIGGLPGYQLQCLELLRGQQQAAAEAASAEGAPQQHLDFLVPVGLDLASPTQREAAAAATAAGLAALPFMAEIYPLGGAGDRLGLCCEQSGESLPTAVLRYCGRSLLENLVRDLQAREYLYWKLHGMQHTTPLALMTSAAKGNHWRVQQLLEGAGWFGRGRAAYRLFQQPLVPVVAAEDGRWLLTNPLEVIMKPGGHGVIWKLMIDEGVFSWLAEAGRRAAIVRQISNPLAGTDNTLLALAGAGFPGGRTFGFASCDRVVGAAEGMNVLAQRRVAAPGHGRGAQRYEYRVTNVEYTEFERLGLADSSVDQDSDLSVFPANTNVLYVGLAAAEGAVRTSMATSCTDALLPGMILNCSKKLSYRDALSGGEERAVPAGRLECTMQNLADVMGKAVDAPLELEEDKAALPTFMVYTRRRKLTSSAKRQRAPGSTRIHQTPDGSFYDLQRNAAELLGLCGIEAPEVGAVPDYLAHGPGLIFLFHPALGPLWEVVAQKLREGRLAPRSEVQLEAAEVCWRNVSVDGSLLVRAAAVMGHTEAPQQASNVVPAAGASSQLRSKGGGAGGEPWPAPEEVQEPLLVYSSRCGRLRLHNVRVENQGIDWAHPGNVYWQHKVARHESCRITLQGHSEFEAHDVTLAGDLQFEVPDGMRMLVTRGDGGQPRVQLLPLEAPTWGWRYSMQPGVGVQLELETISSSSSSSSNAPLG